jgi:hypothetical protein
MKTQQNKGTTNIPDVEILQPAPEKKFSTVKKYASFFKEKNRSSD